MKNKVFRHDLLRRKVSHKAKHYSVACRPRYIIIIAKAWACWAIYLNSKLSVNSGCTLQWSIFMAGRHHDCGWVRHRHWPRPCQSNCGHRGEETSQWADIKRGCVTWAGDQLLAVCLDLCIYHCIVGDAFTERGSWEKYFLTKHIFPVTPSQ